MATSIDDLPREHPSHPYQVVFSFKGKLVDDTYVRASSEQRAMVAGQYWMKNTCRKVKKYDMVSARPVMPVELNCYWNSVNISNPEGLMLANYQPKGQTELFWGE